jgi:tetratricopeptide (TPR) repeat protein
MMRSTILSLVLCAVTLSACNTPSVESKRSSAKWHYDHQRYDEAVVQYTVITDRYPGDFEAQYYLGLSYLGLGEPGEARRALEIAHTRRPKDEDVCDALAEAMFLQGDQSGLFAFLRERAEVAPSVRSQLRLAQYSAEIGDPDSARTALEIAIVIDEANSTEPYLVAASFAEDVGDLDLAVRRLRQAYAIDPYDQMVNDRLRALGEIPGPSIALPPGR